MKEGRKRETSSGRGIPTSEQMFLLEELQQLLGARKKNPLERRVGQYAFGELPHTRIHPSIVEDEYCDRANMISENYAGDSESWQTY